MNHGTGYRSANLSYTSLKFQNSSNFLSFVVFQSFNMTNAQFDNVVLGKNIYHKNLTVIVELFTTGLSKFWDIQFYIILYNLAYMYDTLDRIVFASTESTFTLAASKPINLATNARFRKRERLFTGISGLNLTKSANRSFELKFYQNQVFDFQFNSTGVTSVDFSIISVHVASCSGMTVYSYASNDCISSCPASQYHDYTHTLQFCKPCYYTCSTCWDSKELSCQTCVSPATRQLNHTGTFAGNFYYSCYCKVGYFEVFASNCESCNTYLPGCAKCSNNYTCLQCKIGLTLINSKCVCNNPANFFSIPEMDCIPRIIGCETHLYDGTQLICTECYVERNFTLNSSYKCECQQPTLQIVQDVNLTGEYWCDYICGDGLVGLGEPCDDKNTVSGDGCSAICQVETNFVCSNLPSQPSVCLYNVSVEMLFLISERVLYENTAVFNFTFGPSVIFMNAITNWSDLVATTLPHKKISDNFKCPDLSIGGRCNLTLTIEYTQDIEQKYFEIYLKLSTQPKIKFDSRKLYFKPTGQITTLSYEPQNHLNMIETIHIIALVLVIFGLLIFLASIYFEKMVGLQLILTLQYMYYLMTPIIQNPIEMVPFQRNMKFTTGFNEIYNYTYYRYAPLPIQINHQFIEKQFLMNLNVMLILLVIVLFLLFVVKIYRTIKQKKEGKTQQQKKQEIFENPQEIKKIKLFDKYYKMYWNKVFFIFIFFVLYQVLFSCMITTLKELPNEDIFSPSLNFIAMFLSLFIAVMGLLSVGYWYYQVNMKKGSISLSETQIIPYEFNLCSKTYVMLFTLMQPVKIWIIGILFQQDYCYYVILPFLVTYMIILAVMRPYQERQDRGTSLSQEQNEFTVYNKCMSIHNFGVCFNEFCLIICNVLYMVWNLNAREHTLMDQYPQIMLFISVSLVFLLEVVAVLRLLYKKLGAALFCQYFIKLNPNAITFQNSFKKMRKIVRDDDSKPFHDEDSGAKNQNPQKAKNNKMKILHDLRKAKQFAVDWRDDPKPKYIYNQYKNKYRGTSSEDEGEGDESPSPPRDKTIILESNETSNPDDISFFTNGQNQFERKRSFKNPGVVQMETLQRSAEKANYKINIATEKKVASLSKSIIDLMMERREFQNFSKRKSGGNVQGFGMESSKKGTRSELQELKMRMRKDFQIKNSQIKESFFEDQ